MMYFKWTQRLLKINMCCNRVKKTLFKLRVVPAVQTNILQKVDLSFRRRIDVSLLYTALQAERAACRRLSSLKI